LSDADGGTLHEAITALAQASAAPLAIAAAAMPHAILWANDAFRESARRTTGLMPAAIGADSPDLTLAVAGLVGSMPEAVHIAADPADPARILLRVDPLAGKLKTTLLETIVNHLPDVIYAKDRDARFIFKNLSDVSLMGATSQPEILGKTDFDYYPPDIAQAFFDDDMRVIGGEPVIGKIETIIGEDGRLRAYSTTKVPLRADDGHIVGLVGCGHDVTERFEMEQALERLAEERQAEAERAREALETKSRFLAVMSHEIRTPMGGMLGVARLLAETGLSPEQQRLVDTICECGDGLSMILNDLLDFSRIEAGGLTLETAAFDLADILTAARDLYSPRASEQGLSFDVALRGEGRRWRLGDRHRLMQIVHNLLSNAFKFTECGSVGLSLEIVDDACIHLSVRDSGIGLSADAARRILAPFSQAEPSIARRFGGTGLGLSIVQGLVEAMDGQLSVESGSGAGTTFHARLQLPATEPHGSAPRPATRPEAPARALRVLAAEDSEINRIVLDAALTGAGHHVTLARDGHEAVRHASAQDFDAILLDVSMPGLNGDVALQQMREAAIRSGRTMPPALAVTGYVDADHRQALNRAGFHALIAKPYRVEDLLSALEEAVCGPVATP
jgi:PAS domain S-box-containing protein